MGKKLLAIFAGMVAGVITVGIVETAGHALFPPPAGMDVTNPEILKSMMSQLPLGAKLTVIVAWALGSLVAGLVAGRIAGTDGLIPALIAGSFLLAGGIYSLVTIPHPVWMAVLGVALPLPMAWLGSKMMRPGLKA